ncbi:hypothetical protein D3C71_1516970 [compost metagenome]
MCNRSDLAVALRTDADPLDRGWTMGGVVRDQRPRQRDLDRAPDRFGRECRQHRIDAQKQFTAEAATDKRRHQMHLLLVHAERDGEIRTPPINHLARRPDRNLIAVPRGDRGMRLHHRMRLVGGCVFGLERHRGCRKSCLEITSRTVRFRGRIRCLGIGHLSLEVEGTLFRRVIDPDQSCCRTRLLEGFGHDDGDGLMIMLYLAATEQFGGVELAFL